MFWRDFVSGLRALARHPGVSAVMAGVLALGIGANTAIFSVVDAVLLRPLPYRASDRLVTLPAAHRPDDMGAEVSVAAFLDWRTQTGSFSEIGAWGPASVNLTSGAVPERVPAAQISPGGLAALATRPHLGRLFLAEEERPDSRVVLLSYAFWRTRFGGDPAAVGKTVRLNGFEYPVVGVMPEEFRFPRPDVQLWVPLRLTESRVHDRRSRWLYAFGRLRDGMSLAAAQREMDGVTSRLAAEHPEDRDWGVRVTGLRDSMVGPVRTALWIVFATVLLVLLIACASVANLQLARAAARRREMAIRSALGASSGALLRLLLLEGAALSAIAGGLGLLIARVTLRALVAWSPAALPRLEEIRIDGVVLVFTIGLALATGVLFGLVPARVARRAGLAETLGEAGRSASGGVGHLRLRRLLTIGEVATALVLLTATGLLLASVSRLLRVEPGFESRGVLTAEVVLSSQKYAENGRSAAFFRDLSEGAARIPGVEAAGGVSDLPLAGSNATEGFAIEGRGPVDVANLPEAGARGVTSGYFRAMRIPIVAGRDFSRRDTADAPRVVVVNRALAESAWAGGGAVGNRILLSRGGRLVAHEVVGVVGDIHHSRLDVPTVPEIYLPYEQQAYDDMVLVVRSNLPAGDLERRIRFLVATLDPELPVFHVQAMDRVLDASTMEPRFYAGLLGAFAGLALVLAALGIFSLISYSVAQRRQELAIRLALGAGRRDLLALVVGEGMALAGAGVAAGLLVSLAATRGLGTLLFAVHPNDPLVFAGTAVLLGSVALAATLIPALRASRTSPMLALRGE